MTRTIPRLELWSGLACNGGARLATAGFVWPWMSGTTTESEDSEESFTYDIPLTAEAALIVAENHVTRLWRSDTDYDEWIVRKVVKSRGEGGKVSVTCGPVSYLLAEHGFVAEWQTTDPLGDPLIEFNASGTITDLWQTYLIDNPKVNTLLPPLTLGTITPTVEVSVPVSLMSGQKFINATLDAAAAVAGVPYRFALVRDGSTSYDLTAVAA